MLSFREFFIGEATEGQGTKIEKIKLDISKSFDEISDAKKLKKPGDPNSDIASVDQQSALYTKIAAQMKLLSAEMKKDLAASKTGKNKPTIY